eukprot:gene2824-1809_t
MFNMLLITSCRDCGAGVILMCFRSGNGFYKYFDGACAGAFVLSIGCMSHSCGSFSLRIRVMWVLLNFVDLGDFGFDGVVGMMQWLADFPDSVDMRGFLYGGIVCYNWQNIMNSTCCGVLCGHDLFHMLFITCVCFTLIHGCMIRKFYKCISFLLLFGYCVRRLLSVTSVCLCVLMWLLGFVLVAFVVPFLHVVVFPWCSLFCRVCDQLVWEQAIRMVFDELWLEIILHERIRYWYCERMRLCCMVAYFVCWRINLCVSRFMVYLFLIYFMVVDGTCFALWSCLMNVWVAVLALLYYVLWWRVFMSELLELLHAVICRIEPFYVFVIFVRALTMIVVGSACLLCTVLLCRGCCYCTTVTQQCMLDLWFGMCGLCFLLQGDGHSFGLFSIYFFVRCSFVTYVYVI